MATAISVGVLGSRYTIFDAKSGVGNAFSSTFPVGVVGTLSMKTTALGSCDVARTLIRMR